MRVRKNPDKWIRKSIIERINSMVVSGLTIPCIDTNYTGQTQPQHYIAMSSQTKRDDQTAKCGWEWDCTILLDAITRYPSTGNTGSRVLLNDIEDKVILLLNDLELDGGFKVDSIVLEDSTSIDGSDQDEVYFRQLIRYNIHLTELKTT